MLKVAQGLREIDELFEQEGINPKNIQDVDDSTGSKNAKFGLIFTVPKICLTLKTNKKTF